MSNDNVKVWLVPPYASAKVLPKYSNIEVYVDGKLQKEYLMCHTYSICPQIDNDLFHIRALCRNNYYTAEVLIKPVYFGKAVELIEERSEGQERVDITDRFNKTY